MIALPFTPSNFKEKTMTQAQRTAEASGKVIYTAKTHTIGARENGVSRSSDGQLEIKLSPPGSSRPGTNPEQLFAAGWSACFEGALGVAALKKKIKLTDVAIDAEVDLHLDRGEYFLSARLNVSIPGVERSIAQGLVEDASRICPYSKATKGNIDVTYNVV
jgi:lipoyl-dependent peroxiredoxin